MKFTDCLLVVFRVCENLLLRYSFFQSVLVSAIPMTPASRAFAVINMSDNLVGLLNMPFALMKKSLIAVVLCSLCGCEYEVSWYVLRLCVNFL